MNTPNYTPEMIATIKASQPLNLAKAKKEGFEYIAKPAPAKKKAAPSKADMVTAICSALDCDPIVGLEKSTGSALSQLLMAIR